MGVVGVTAVVERQERDELADLRARLRRREDRERVRAEVRAERAQRRAAQRREALARGARLAGEAARLRHRVSQSGEARALRVEQTRTIALVALLPVLAAFGAWSAAGVQAGMVALLGLEPASAAAAAAWLVEPALLGIVAGVILLRARLRSAGGDLDERATWMEWAALITSIVLNMAGHWPEQMDGAALAAMAGHALGPLGAAGTALLISVVMDGVTDADPWHLDDGTLAPTLGDGDDEGERPSAHGAAHGELGERSAEGVSAQVSAPAPVAVRPAMRWIDTSGARLLPIVAAEGAERPVSAQATTGERSVEDQATLDHAEHVRRILADHFQAEIAQLAERGTAELTAWLETWSAPTGGGAAVLPAPADPPAIEQAEQGDGEGERSGERPEAPLSAAERREAIARELAADPSLTGPQLSERTGIPESTARRLRSQVLGELSAHDEQGGGGERP